MSSKPLHISARILFCLLFIQHAFSQTPISVRASVNRNLILIGEPVQLTLEVKTPLGAGVNWFPSDSIPHFEFVQLGKVDSAITETEKSFRQDILLTSFDSGTWVIPQLPVQINGATYLTDSATIDVRFSKFNPNQEYNDIKDIVEVPNPYAPYIAWSVAAITLLSLVLAVYFLLKKRALRQSVQAEPPRLSPYEEAVQSLDELKAQRLPAKGEVKLYYTRLNDILRQFVLRKLQIASLSKTNEELILQLRDLDLSKDQFSRLAQALRISDFVKFAKYLPDENDNEQNFTTIRSSVDLLNTIEK